MRWSIPFVRERVNYMTESKISKEIDIEIAYALANKQVILAQKIDSSMKPREALKASNILESFPELDLDNIDIGVFGKAIKDDYSLQQGDRIELYRPLIADPKEVRRQRAKKGLATKKGGGKKEI